MRFTQVSNSRIHSLGAKENMAIDELAAQKLIDKYIRKQYNIYR